MRIKSVLGAVLLSVVSVMAVAKVPLDKIAAIVNDGAITVSELSQHMLMVEQELKHQQQPVPNMDVLQKQVLDKLINNEVQLQLAKRTGIYIDEAQLDELVATNAKQNNLTVSQFREALAREGIDYNLYRKTLKQEKVISQLQQRDIIPDIQVRDHEINQFIDSPNGLGSMTIEYRLGHILVPLSETPTPEDVSKNADKAADLIKRLRGGADFANIAINESSGPLALNGGDLGWKKQAELPTLFAQNIHHMQMGEIPDVIRSSSGFHIIKLIDKRKAQIPEYNVDKTQVRHILLKSNALTSEQDVQYKLNDFREKLIKKELDFNQLAKTSSEDLASASKGGELGWVTDDVLVPEFSTVMHDTKVGEISQPFSSPFGWHILEVIDRKTEDDSANHLRQIARNMIMQRKFEEKLVLWQRQLRDEAYIKIYVGG